MKNSLTFVRPISDRGQVVVPKDIRNHLGLKDEVVFEVVDDHVEIHSNGDKFLDEFLSIPRKAVSPEPSEFKKQLLDQYADLH